LDIVRKLRQVVRVIIQKANAMSGLHIGTSGWSYDNWSGDFYPEGMSKSNYLEYYVERFNSVEVNATFYRLPFENIVKGWRNKAHEDFLYSVKGHRRITHYNKLKDIEDNLNHFLSRVRRLGDSLKTVFWQFPPSFDKDLDRLKKFIQKLPNDQHFAFEFRDTSWLDEEVYDLLRDNNAAIVWQSSGEFPDDCTPTADFIYIRFHGLTGYKYSYKESDLKPWAEIIQEHLDEGRDAQVYFNNAGGNPTESAKMLREMLN
jgi:uncharacterized protein YecE (DUF72 family)